MELLKAHPFSVLLFSEKYQTDVVYTVSMTNYVPSEGRIYFYLYCMEDEAPVIGEKCYCSSMDWLKLINSSLEEQGLVFLSKKMWISDRYFYDKIKVSLMCGSNSHTRNPIGVSNPLEGQKKEKGKAQTLQTFLFYIKNLAVGQGF